MFESISVCAKFKDSSQIERRIIVMSNDREINGQL